MDECQNLMIDFEEFEDAINDDAETLNMGQSESKKSSKRTATGCPETKGTAMSFGFRKKLLSSNKKNANNLQQTKEKEKENDFDFIDDENKYLNNKIISTATTVITNSGHNRADDFLNPKIISDNNGNSGSESTSEKNTDIVKRPNSRTSQQTTNKRETVSNALTYKGSRFGFKTTNTIRPASTGLTPKLTDFEANIENNNIEKRRSKSASGSHSGRSLASVRFQINEPQSDEKKISVPKINSSNNVTFNINNNQRSQQQTTEKRYISDIQTIVSHSSDLTNNKSPSNQYTIINTGMHTNVIVKPTPQPGISVSKFTLHTSSLPKPQYPVPISLSTGTTASQTGMDSKNAKQMMNNNRKGFFAPRDISTDSGIASLDQNYDHCIGGNSSAGGVSSSVYGTGAIPSSPRRQRNKPRNLEMVISGRHKFEVRDLFNDALSCDSIEPLVLPKLPSVFSSNNQTVPLSGLLRTNSTLNNDTVVQHRTHDTPDYRKINRNSSDCESIEEEKLFRDRSTSEKDSKNSLKEYSISSKNSSPGSSRASWCNAGESLALKDCSSLSLSSSDESKDNQNEKIALNIREEDINSVVINDHHSSLFILTEHETVPKFEEQQFVQEDNLMESTVEERPTTLSNIAETKFAEMAAAVSDILLDDETSPTDSLVSSTESDEVLMKKTKKRINEEIKEKDIDEISPELELCSPTSPGTPTHASNSFSLSDGGRDFLIDDEIADQPALLFSDKADLIDAAQILHSLTDTPTLIESISIKSSAQNQMNKSKSGIGNNNIGGGGGTTIPSAIDFSLRTPISKRKNLSLHRAESLDTLSPCESIASDDLMMDFESHSSLDSIDRLSHSIRSQSGSALQAMDDATLWSELEAKSGEMIREWNNILQVHKTGKDNILTQLPARATRLLNRSRLQQSQLSITGSDSPRSGDSLPRKSHSSSRASSLHFSGREPINSSSDDLLIHDKSFRNSMIQDVLYFKKQLIRLRRILQETDTLNPFELNNGTFFGTCNLDSSQQTDELKDINNSLTSSAIDDPKEELADLRRQVVYLQGQVDDRDRTIRMQKNIIEKLEAEKEQNQTVSVSTSISEKECVNCATQTERVRPLSIGQEGIARSKPECINYAAYLPATTMIVSTTTSSPTTITTGILTNQPHEQHHRRHTIISTTLTNHTGSQLTPRRASIGFEKFNYKPVKTTLIGEPLNSNNTNNTNGNIYNSKTTLKKQSLQNDCIKTDHDELKMNGRLNSIVLKSPTKKLNGDDLKMQFNNTNCLSITAKTSPTTKCHTNNLNNFDDHLLTSEHHSQTITIV